MEKPAWEEKIECICSSKQHMVVLEYDPEWGLALHFQGNQFQNIWKRMWVALKFVFGVRRGYSFWDNAVVRKEDAVKFRNWLDQAEKNGYGIGNE